MTGGTSSPWNQYFAVIEWVEANVEAAEEKQESFLKALHAIEFHMAHTLQYADRLATEGRDGDGSHAAATFELLNRWHERAVASLFALDLEDQHEVYTVTAGGGSWRLPDGQWIFDRAKTAGTNRARRASRDSAVPGRFSYEDSEYADLNEVGEAWLCDRYVGGDGEES